MVNTLSNRVVGQRVEATVDGRDTVAVAFERSDDTGGISKTDAKQNGDRIVAVGSGSDVEVDEVSVAVFDGMSNARGAIVGTRTNDGKLATILVGRKEKLFGM